MGMDVYGANKDTYFRANIWSWPSIVAATEAAIGKPVPDSWHYNDGTGVEGMEMTPAQIAEAIETMFFPNGEPTDPDIEVPVIADPTTLKGTATMGEQIINALNIPGAEVIAPGRDYGPRAGHLWDWCVFLRECGDNFRIC